MAKEPRKAKQEMRQSYAEYGMKMSGVTVEKFDATYEVEMLALCSAREVQVERLKELSRLYLARDVGFTITELVSVLVSLRWSSLEVVESVMRWRTRLVHKEPVRWREKNGSSINYLLKMCRDAERWCSTFNLSNMLGISMGQRNPFMMPLFPSFSQTPAFVPNSRIRRFLPLQGVIRQDLLLDHVRAAYSYSNGLMGGDVPRLWWTSDEERNVAIYGILSSLTEFATKGSPEMFARVAEANQYLQQEDSAASKKGRTGKSQQNSNGKVTQPAEPNPEWGFDAWVKMPYAVGPYPREKADRNSSLSVSDGDASEGASSSNTLDAAARHKAWQAERAAAAGKDTGRRKFSVDDLASRSLDQRYDVDLAGRAKGGVPTSFEAKLRSPPPKPPWWGVGAAAFDADMFRSAQERSAEERRHMPTIAFEGGDNEDDSLSERDGYFPMLSRGLLEALPPPSASGSTVSKARRTDDAAAVLEAEADAAAEALSLPDLPTKTKEVAARATKDASAVTEKGKDPDRAKMMRKEAAKLDQIHKSKVAEHLAKRRQAARKRFEASLRDSASRSHDEILRVLTHCEDEAAEPLPRPTLLTAAQAAAAVKSTAVEVSKHAVAASAAAPSRDTSENAAVLAVDLVASPSSRPESISETAALTTPAASFQSAKRGSTKRTLRRSSSKK